MSHSATSSTFEIPTIDVVVITFRRPEVVRTNLEHLARQTAKPAQILVVDSSPDELTERVVKNFPHVQFVNNPSGAGNMTSSRNEVLPRLRADVIAFLDDDAFPEAGYIAALQVFYARRPEASLGCCRTMNGVPGEAALGVDSIGRMLPNGTILGYFGADPGEDRPVDHGIGATMHMRRALLRELGGFREYYTGVSGVREDSDLFMRAADLGLQAWFVRDAVALHIGAPQAKGRRFDLRYRHWATRNHTILILANVGLFTRRGLRCLATPVALVACEAGPIHKRAVRVAVVVAGLTRGMVVALRTFGIGPVPPRGGFRQNGRPLSLPPA